MRDHTSQTLQDPRSASGFTPFWRHHAVQLPPEIQEVPRTIFVILQFFAGNSTGSRPVSRVHSGVVTDPSGAVVPGATVTLTDTSTNHTDTATTTAAGVYTFNALPPNNFTLTVTATGFKKKTLNNVQILPEQANSVNVQLALGASAQTVTVNGSQASLLNTETATLSGTVTDNEIQHLPSFNRDVFQLAQLAPGTFGDASQGSAGGSFNLPGSAGPGGSGPNSGWNFPDRKPGAGAGDRRSKRYQWNFNRWHQHRQRGLGRRLGHHPKRRFGAIRHYRFQQLRRGEWALQRRTNSGHLQVRH